MCGIHSAQLLQVRMCDVETMSLVGYKIGYIVNFVTNPDCHLDSKWRSRNRGDGGMVSKKPWFSCLEERRIDPMQRCDGKLLSIATCSRRMSMVSLTRIANCDTSVVFALQMQCELAIRSKDRTCMRRTDYSQTVPRWRQLGRQIWKVNRYVRGT